MGKSIILVKLEGEPGKDLNKVMQGMKNTLGDSDTINLGIIHIITSTANSLRADASYFKNNIGTYSNYFGQVYMSSTAFLDKENFISSDGFIPRMFKDLAVSHITNMLSKSNTVIVVVVPAVFAELTKCYFGEDNRLVVA